MLSNPTRNEIDRLSKHILSNINTRLNEKNNANDWRSMVNVITCLKAIKKKKNSHSFLIFAMKRFLSISEQLLKTVIKYFPNS